MFFSALCAGLLAHKGKTQSYSDLLSKIHLLQQKSDQQTQPEIYSFSDVQDVQDSNGWEKVKFDYSVLVQQRLHFFFAAYFADKLSVTESYLNKCVKSVTLKPPKHWINEIDINYSKALLHSSKDIAEITYELNFHTAFRFTQLFKKIAGVTPKEYRTQLLQSRTTV
ncbi:helix-turn-helix domain-containing protein [Chryseobacterium jejuense]|uniref:helix-turn-helix domain-containing protein n=1 Tax=Chryseobacterium jejuense TaxID=445960 RepID=UPI001D64D61E|nr:helix-turn-helix domain-containing protein [Chryseobacterium jejuense]MBP2616569.1 AraC-like DNA-binding protein [Chryseobacterium jejuense]